MKKNIKKIFCFIYINIIPIQIVAQDIKTIISKINQDTSYYPNSVELVEIQNKFDNFFYETQNQQSTLRVKALLVNVYFEATINDTITKDRRKVVEFLSKSLLDSSSAIRAYAISCIIKYKKNDFSNESINNIKNIFFEECRKCQNDQLIKLIGFLNQREFIPYLLEKYKIKENIKYKPEDIEWPIMLALARMGDINANKICLEGIKNEISRKEYNGRALEYAYYLRNQNSLEILINVFNSDEVVADISKPTIKVPVAYFSFQYLKKFILNLPSSINTSIFNNEVLKVERNWIKINRNKLIIDESIF